METYKSLTVEMLTEVEMNLRLRCVYGFFRFLKDNNAYDDYMYEMLNRNYINQQTICKSSANLQYKLIHLYDPRYWVSHFFVWSTTKQGTKYWSKLSNDWKLICPKYVLPF